MQHHSNLSASPAAHPPHVSHETNPAPQWTAGKQAQFLHALAAAQCVATAARSVGMSRQSAYRLRARLKGQPFDFAWQCAFRRRFDTLAEIALDRAVNGTEVPHYYKGELIGTHRTYDARLTLAMLTMQQRLTGLPKSLCDEDALYHPDDFEALVERVAEGAEKWAEDLPDDEWE